jgi:hypothetical protein
VQRSTSTINSRPSDEAERAALIRGRHKHLSAKLEHLAGQLATSDPKNWAAKIHRRINRAADRKRHDKLTAWHIKNVARPISTSENDAPIPKSIVQAVFLKSRLSELRGRPRGRDDDLVKRAKRTSFDDLRPHEKQAAALIGGAKRKAKKNLIEEAAEKLASSLILSANAPIGRPKGSPPNKIAPLAVSEDGDKEALNYYSVPLSITDMCEVIVPLIEEITGRRITSPRGSNKSSVDHLAFDVLVAVINIDIPAVELSSVRRAIHRLKRTD